MELEDFICIGIILAALTLWGAILLRGLRRGRKDDETLTKGTGFRHGE